MKPLISVIIPAYNNASTIHIALESIQRQTYSNLEIVVVDDNSTDETAAIVKKIASLDPRIKLIKSDFIDPNRYSNILKRNINAGYSARNTGFKACSGILITFQDGDDASLLNRIEIQYELLTKHDATHLCLDWQQFDESYLGKKFDVSTFKKEHGIKEIGPDELYRLSQKTKGMVAKMSKRLNALIPFSIKRKRVINKLFFGSLESYPGISNSPLFRREVIEKVQFRKLSNRVWPSFMGRGADRDFNFQVAETFKNSMIIEIPLYLWRVTGHEERYKNYEKYMIN